MKGYSHDETSSIRKKTKGKYLSFLERLQVNHYDYTSFNSRLRTKKTANTKKTQKAWRAIKAIVVASRRSDDSVGSDGVG